MTRRPAGALTAIQTKSPNGRRGALENFEPYRDNLNLKILRLPVAVHKGGEQAKFNIKEARALPLQEAYSILIAAHCQCIGLAAAVNLKDFAVLTIRLFNSAIPAVIHHSADYIDIGHLYADFQQTIIVRPAIVRRGLRFSS